MNPPRIYLQVHQVEDKEGKRIKQAVEGTARVARFVTML